MHLVVTSRARIVAAYGAGAFDRLGTALLSYSNALGGRIPHELLTVNDAASAQLVNIAPVAATDASSIASSIRAARQAAAHPVTSVLLVGGPDAIPFFILPSPVPNDDDTRVPSDNPYGCATGDDATYATPDIPVGRAVGSQDGGIDSLLAHLAAMTALHHSAPAQSGALALGCSIWQPFTTAVLQAMDPAGFSVASPSYRLNSSTTMEIQRRLLYFNLHGQDTGSDWWGADTERYYDCVSPADLGAANLHGAVIFAANCFGAAIEGRSASASCGLSAVRAGVQAFIGSTCTSFGSGDSSKTVPVYSDRLAQLFFQTYDGAGPAGDALVAARIAYVRENLIGGYLNAWEHKTALQFIFLGDPTL